METLLDTNVLSELIRSRPDPAVLRWFSEQRAEALFVSAVTQAEMMLGVRLLPKGKRRSMLENAVRTVFAQDFAGRILPFDAQAVPAYVDIVARRKESGRPISQFDAQIAAIASRRGARIATRNVRDFVDSGAVVVDPWSEFA